MPFSDVQLADVMSKRLVIEGAMTERERDVLLDNPTEINVEMLSQNHGLSDFKRAGSYWGYIWIWMGDNDGNVTLTNGTNMSGCVGDNPVIPGLRVSNNDAFRHFNHHIGIDKFLLVKAVSNQLRFISLIKKMNK